MKTNLFNQSLVYQLYVLFLKILTATLPLTVTGAHLKTGSPLDFHGLHFGRNIRLDVP